MYKRFYRPLFLLCRRFFPDDRDALEALNDGMLKVFRNLSAYQPGKGTFFNWAYTVVRNTALDKLPRQRWFTSVPDDSIEIAGTNPLEKLEQKDIYVLLDALQPATRVVCTLFYLEGYSIKEISVRLGIRDGTVKWHLSETRNKLREVFKKHYSN